MAKLKDLAGNRYGRLTVVELAMFVDYGGRKCSVWTCVCDCGSAINLEYDKLPVTAKQQQTMMKSGRRLYDCCESCRDKTCVVCGSKFSYSHTSHICPSHECQDRLAYERDRFWHNFYKFRRQTDAAFREEENAKARSRHLIYGAVKNQRRRDAYSAASDAERSAIRAAARAAYAEMRSDPDRYRQWMQWQRAWRGRSRLKSMISDAAKLQSIFEAERDNG